MAGLLKQPQAPDPTQQGAPEQPPGLMQQSGQPERPEADESDPAFQTAMKFAMTALYEKGAADNVSNLLKAAPDIVEALATTAYEMTGIVDEKTEGNVPDELLVLLAARILEEIVDIAVASGVQVEQMMVAEAFKVMILRYVGDQGYDTRELQASMDAVPPEEMQALMADQTTEQGAGLEAPPAQPTGPPGAPPPQTPPIDPQQEVV